MKEKNWIKRDKETILIIIKEVGKKLCFDLR